MSPLPWWRSWPAGPLPAGRAFVADSLPRLLMSGCDYRTVVDHQPWPDADPGFCMLEWDVALASEERARFAAHAAAAPGRVLVAPYMIYPVGRGPVLVHKSGPGRMRTPVRPGQRWAHSFGFGCIYFPRAVLARWFEERPGARFNDARFSDWHIARYGTVEVDWSVRPQHLHGD